MNFEAASGNADLSWLQPLGREPSEEPFCEQEEQDDFRGVGCHMFTPCSISSRATVNIRSKKHHHIADALLTAARVTNDNRCTRKRA